MCGIPPLDKIVLKKNWTPWKNDLRRLPLGLLNACYALCQTCFVRELPRNFRIRFKIVYCGFRFRTTEVQVVQVSFFILWFFGTCSGFKISFVATFSWWNTALMEIRYTLNFIDNVLHFKWIFIYPCVTYTARSFIIYFRLELQSHLF